MSAPFGRVDRQYGKSVTTPMIAAAVFLRRPSKGRWYAGASRQ
jgi:hypothetical protein